jgi:hypothetical protein
MADHAEVRYLGYGEVDAYGMSWRVQATSGRINNEFHDNVTASFWLKTAPTASFATTSSIGTGTTQSCST